MFEVRRSMRMNSEHRWVADDDDDDGICGYVNEIGGLGVYFDFRTEARAQAALDLYLKKQEKQEKQEKKRQAKKTAALITGYDVGLDTALKKMREFNGGATRDTTQGKLDYVKALSPIVLRRYVQYLDKHRLLPDGSYREFDNWKQGIPQDVYHSSNGRHFFDVWLLTEGYTIEDNHGPVTLEDALCAELFNIMGRLHEILRSKASTPGYGGDVKCGKIS